jgi:hypothetical protein
MPLRSGCVSQTTVVDPRACWVRGLSDCSGRASDAETALSASVGHGRFPAGRAAPAVSRRNTYAQAHTPAQARCRRGKPAAKRPQEAAPKRLAPKRLAPERLAPERLAFRAPHLARSVSTVATATVPCAATWMPDGPPLSLRPPPDWPLAVPTCRRAPGSRSPAKTAWVDWLWMMAVDLELALLSACGGSGGWGGDFGPVR